MKAWSITVAGLGLMVSVELAYAVPVPPLPTSQQEQLERLVQSLASDKEETRKQAIEGVLRLGRSAVPVLARLVESPATQTREAAMFAAYAMVRAGADQRYPEIVPVLTRGLLDEVPTIRKAAALAASEVVTILADPASERAGQEPKNLPYLIGQRREEFIRALVSLLGDSDNTVRLSVTTALTDLGREALPQIIPVLADENPLKRLAAARVIADMGSNGRRYPQLLPDLLNRLHQEKDAQVAEVLSRALGTLADFLTDAPPKLLPTQQLPKITAQERQEVFRLMLAGLESKDPLTRRSLVDSLARLGPSVDEALVQTLKSDQPKQRAGVLEVLIARFARGNLPVRFVSPVLQQLEEENDAELRLLALQTLARFAPALAPDAPADLRQQLASLVPAEDQRKVGQVLVQSLGQTDEVAKQAILSAVAHLHESVAEAVAEVLQKGQPLAQQQAALALRAMKGYGKAGPAVRRAAEAVVSANLDAQTVTLARQIIARLDQMK
jgi:HEAT repeat protein